MFEMDRMPGCIANAGDTRATHLAAGFVGDRVAKKADDAAAGARLDRDSRNAMRSPPVIRRGIVSMKPSSAVLGSIAVVVALSACGGGGGDSGGTTSSTPTTTTTTPTTTTTTTTSTTTTTTAKTYSQTDANTVAVLGMTAERMTDQWNQSLLWGLDFIVADFGYLADGNPRCGKGSATSVVSKAGSYKGLNAGDQVTITFSQCELLFGLVTFDGVVKLTAMSQISMTQTYAYDIAYEIETTGLSFRNSKDLYQPSGVLDVATHRATVDVARKLSVPAGKSFAVTMNVNSKTTALTYDAGASFSDDVLDYSDLSQKVISQLDGPISIGDGQSAAIALTMATPTPLNLILYHNGSKIISVVPYSGVVNTSWSNPVLATSATVDNANLSVSGDSDGNGSLDLMSNTTWAALFPN